MKTVGILTLQNTVNYGAMLQVSALQSVLESLGVTCQVLNYTNHVVEARESSTRFSLNPRKFVRYAMRHGFEKRREEGFARFVCAALHLTDPMDSRALLEYVQGLDCLVVGSDQVWSPRINGRDAIYFGRGMSPSTKLVTYAASLGGASIEEMLLYDSNLKIDLARFSHVSVREASSIPVLAQLGIQASWSPDPTFLLTGDQWVQKYASIADKPKHRYVLMYTLNGEKELVDAAQTYARAHGIEAVALHYNTRGFNGFTNIRDASPSDFLQLMHGARCIFTDSFHGTCFALNFGKEFYVKLSKAKPHGNARMVDLLERYGVTGRYLDTSKAPAPPLDHATIQESLNRDRRQGLGYLENCVLRG